MNKQEGVISYQFGTTVDLALRFFYENANTLHNGARLPVNQVFALPFVLQRDQEDCRRTYVESRVVRLNHGMSSETVLTLQSWMIYSADGKRDENGWYGRDGNWRVTKAEVNRRCQQLNTFIGYPSRGCDTLPHHQFLTLRKAVCEASERMQENYNWEKLLQCLKETSEGLGIAIVESCHDAWVKRLLGNDDDAAVV